MFITITFCENCFGTRSSYPNRSWGLLGLPNTTVILFFGNSCASIFTRKQKLLISKIYSIRVQIVIDQTILNLKAQKNATKYNKSLCT